MNPQERLIVNKIIPTLNKLKYIIYKNQINLVAIRNKNHKSDTFDDSLFVFKVDKSYNLLWFKRYIITTEPGLYWLLKPMNRKGTAILKPGQYVGAYKLGYHGRGKNRHRALVQVRPVTVFRDNNKDKNIDLRITDTGLFGVNIHRASGTFNITELIDRYSAGCQVFQNKLHQEEFISICDDSKLSTFTYTLLNETDLI